MSVDPQETAAVDYKSTVFLPKTDFPMRAGLPKKEPQILARWAEMDLYQRLRAQSKDRTRFVLHDGPPYANGNLHIGTGLNKILKDIVVRSQQMLGKDANYVPGWDCHGLPIEWKVEERYREKGRNKDDVPVLQFRQECREFAEHWVGVQSEEFQRLGVVGNWQMPYLTMTKPAEAQIVREIHKFLANGSLYKGMKPVMWSVVEKTALAEAEVEYQDHTSTTIWVRFPVRQASDPALDGASVLIWTTTPWTIPANRAVAYGPEMTYGIYRVASVAEDSHARVGERLMVSTALADQVAADCGIADWTLEHTLPGTALAGTVCDHPLRGHSAAEAYSHPVPALAADFVTTDQGTGIVHIAPSHGADDFDLGTANGLAAEETVAEDGTYTGLVPGFTGLAVITAEGRTGPANRAVVEALTTTGRLAGRGTLRHSYPHSWRSKAPLIFRATPQWFIAMDDANGLRDTALAALKETRFVPAAGYNRLSSMVENRPDWCISRQRAWGVPIALFVNRQTREPLRDPAVLDRIAAAFEADGSDAWFARDPQEFLGNAYSAEDFEQVFDIVDVWFESGATHAFVLEARDGLETPADLYLEGSDQHRGWFQSSLLESCGTRGRAPFKAVLTHGFVMAEDGYKMSKSRGNSVAPQDVVDQNGADILRLWVVGSDFTEDLKIGPEILRYQVDAYRRLRNTLRYLLGALDGFDAGERVPAAEMPELERYILHRMAVLDTDMRAWLEAFDFHAVYKALYQFCAVDLSAFYFDIRKDALYCDAPGDPRRRAARTVMDQVFEALTAWLAPILCFTAEEAWWTRHGEAAGSVHERLFPAIPAEWRDDTLAAKWETIRRVRRVVTGALELERAEKRIGASLQAHPVVYVSAAQAEALKDVAFQDVVITSGVTVSVGNGPETAFRLADVPEVSVVVGLAEGEKCQRCWKVLPEVGAVPGYPQICRRCADAVRAQIGAA